MMNSAAICAAILGLALMTAARAQTSVPAPSELRGQTAPAADATPRLKKEKKEKKAGGGLPGFGNSAEPTGPITTQIFSDEASFDSAKYVGVFSGHVIVNDPRFNLQSDKLTIFIRKGAAKNGEAIAEKGKESPDGAEGEGLEKAIAEGNVGVVKETADANGGPPTRAIGRSDKAVYTTGDGNVELTGSPRVQQGLNSHVATSEDTVMILNQSGQLTTHGPSRTEIRQEPKASPAPEAAKPAAPVTAPAKSVTKPLPTKP